MAASLPLSDLTLMSVTTLLQPPNPTDLLSSLNVPSLKVPNEFLRCYFEKMHRAWEELISFKKQRNLDCVQQQVVELTRCLYLLKEYTADMDKSYLDERGFPPHGKYVVFDIK